MTMLQQYCQTYYQRWCVQPLVKRIPTHYSPLFFTYLALVSGGAVFLLSWLGHPWLASLALLLSGYWDTIDGAFARLTQQTSELGTASDIMADRCVELLTLLALFAVDPSSRGWYCLLMLGACMLCITCFLVTGIFITNHSDKGFYYQPGLIERAEALLFFTAMLLLPQYFAWLASILTGLVLFTALAHFKQFKSQL